MVSLGYTVQGSDLKDSANVQRLREKGVVVHIGHDAQNIMNGAGEKTDRRCHLLCCEG